MEKNREETLYLTHCKLCKLNMYTTLNQKKNGKNITDIFWADLCFIYIYIYL